MKIIVVSDSHCERGMLLSLAEEIAMRGDVDAIIHLGDVESDAKWLHERLNIPVYSVPGNCDFNLSDPAERVITLEGVPMLLCHGHTLRVKYTLDSLAYRAEELGVKLALFGHTHQPFAGYVGGVMLLNPGALNAGKYAILEIEKGNAVPFLKEL